MHYTIRELQALDSRYPTDRKLLLVPSVNFGRELLGALARKNGAWVGWEVATLGTIADELAVIPLARQRLRLGSDVVIADTIHAAFDQAIAAGEVGEVLSALAWNAGMRAAVASAVLELRMAMVGADSLKSAALGSAEAVIARSLSSILARYERLLVQRNLADSATLFQLASEAFSDEAPFVLDHALMVTTPGWTVRGASRRLFQQMVDRGLSTLNPLAIAHLVAPDGLVETLAAAVQKTGETDVVSHAPAMFYAGSTSDELREVLRRAVRSGVGMDEMELCCTDRDDYGATLESLCSHLKANYTSLDGLPLSSTRIGRALEHWFAWIENDYATDHIRRALETADWSLPAAGSGAIVVPVVEAVQELRRMRIGWGLKATARAMHSLRQDGHPASNPVEETDASRDRRRTVRDAVAGLLEFLLKRAPHEAGAPDGRIAKADLARRTHEVLELVTPHGPAEEATLDRLRERLAQIAELPRPAEPVVQALTALRADLADLRAWTSASNTGRPRRATGGHVHLTNIESAGATGRPLLFFVGLDADRTAGPVLQSPLLPEWLRERLNERGAGLATIEQRRRERAWQLALAMGGSESSVTMSFAQRTGVDGRESGPAPAMLHAAREAADDPTLSYEALLKSLGEPASPIATSPDFAIDARDVMLASMVDGPLLLDARPLARVEFPGVERGLRAVAERDANEAGHYHGLVPAAGVLDPRTTDRPVSPSSLEMLASCSLRWFYHTALDARLPEEPEFDPMRWLNVLDRGTALHLIYERVIREQLHEQTDVEMRTRAVDAIADAVVERMTARVPAASSVIRDREIAALKREAQLFVTSEHDEFRANPWQSVALEYAFGEGEEATFPLDDGSSVRVRGRVDRVDRLADGTLRLVDYKTGRSFTLDMKRGAFDGGRKLQLAVYSPAVSRQFDAAVSAAEYRFPTQRGEGIVARADAALISAAPRIVRSLLDDVAAGRFVPTIDKDDCAFCNYAAICRVSTGEFSTTSPRADWAKRSADSSPHFVGIRARAVKTERAE